MRSAFESSIVKALISSWVASACGNVLTPTSLQEIGRIEYLSIIIKGATAL